jgi:signal peptidase I
MAIYRSDEGVSLLLFRAISVNIKSLSPVAFTIYGCSIFSFLSRPVTDPRPTVARSSLSAAVRWCVCLLLLVAFLQTWLLDGLLSSYQIAGGSMAGTLLGRHRDVACADCGYKFSCDADVLPAATRAVCPNCGYAANDLGSVSDISGERVLIDRTAFSFRELRRWEVVAFRWPQPADALVVKRVVGLPGESIDIRNGDVYVDGRMERKNLSQQHALAVLVYDANFEPAREPKPPPRWRAESAESRWSLAGRRFVHAAGPDDEPMDWLGYHHWRRLAGEEGSVRETPVTDICGYNQSQPRREEDVHAEADLMLSFRLAEVTGHGLLVVRVTDGRDDFEVQLGFDGDRPRYKVFHGIGGWDGSTTATPTDLAPTGPASASIAAGAIPAGHGFWIVEVSLVDQQLLLAIDGQTLVTWPFERSEPACPSACPFSIGSRGLGATVCDLRVYRDVYYTEPIGRLAGAEIGRPMRLEAGQYYVLGDNSPISEDSRTWPEGGAVDAKCLLGKPLAAIPSIQLLSWGRWHFQVPNPARIRYIR